MWKNTVPLMAIITVCYSCNTDSNHSNQKVDQDTIQQDTIQVVVPAITVKNLDDSKEIKVIVNTTSQVRQPISQYSDMFRMRRFDHVTALYQELAKNTIDMCVNHNVPPAAVLSIISLESGWGNGYIGQITGNILSLGTRKGNYELPALTLPVIIESGEVIFDPIDLGKYDSSQWEMKNRPASLKKDYRPSHIAGSTKDLAYFKYHPEERLKARLKCINDFLTIFISEKSRITAYREAEAKMDDIVQEGGKEALFTKQTNEIFINAIGGRPNTFNFRETWPKKVLNVIDNAGLIDLTSKMYLDNQSFMTAW